MAIFHSTESANNVVTQLEADFPKGNRDLVTNYLSQSEALRSLAKSNSWNYTLRPGDTTKKYRFFVERIQRALVIVLKSKEDFESRYPSDYKTFVAKIKAKKYGIYDDDWADLVGVFQKYHIDLKSDRSFGTETLLRLDEDLKGVGLFDPEAEEPRIVQDFTGKEKIYIGKFSAIYRTTANGKNIEFIRDPKAFQNAIVAINLKFNQKVMILEEQGDYFYVQTDITEEEKLDFAEENLTIRGYVHKDFIWHPWEMPEPNAQIIKIPNTPFPDIINNDGSLNPEGIPNPNSTPNVADLVMKYYYFVDNTKPELWGLPTGYTTNVDALAANATVAEKRAAYAADRTKFEEEYDAFSNRGKHAADFEFHANLLLYANNPLGTSSHNPHIHLNPALGLQPISDSKAESINIYENNNQSHSNYDYFLSKLKEDNSAIHWGNWNNTTPQIKMVHGAEGFMWIPSKSYARILQAYVENNQDTLKQIYSEVFNGIKNNWPEGFGLSVDASLGASVAIFGADVGGEMKLTRLSLTPEQAGGNKNDPNRIIVRLSKTGFISAGLEVSAGASAKFGWGKRRKKSSVVGIDGSPAFEAGLSAEAEAKAKVAFTVEYEFPLYDPLTPENALLAENDYGIIGMFAAFLGLDQSFTYKAISTFGGMLGFNIDPHDYITKLKVVSTLATSASAGAKFNLSFGNSDKQEKWKTGFKTNADQLIGRQSEAPTDPENILAGIYANLGLEGNAAFGFGFEYRAKYSENDKLARDVKNGAHPSLLEGTLHRLPTSVEVEVFTTGKQTAKFQASAGINLFDEVNGEIGGYVTSQQQKGMKWAFKLNVPTFNPGNLKDVTFSKSLFDSTTLTPYFEVSASTKNLNTGSSTSFSYKIDTPIKITSFAQLPALTTVEGIVDVLEGITITRKYDVKDLLVGNKNLQDNVTKILTSIANTNPKKGFFFKKVNILKGEMDTYLEYKTKLDFTKPAVRTKAIAFINKVIEGLATLKNQTVASVDKKGVLATIPDYTNILQNAIFSVGLDKAFVSLFDEFEVISAKLYSESSSGFDLDLDIGEGLKLELTISVGYTISMEERFKFDSNNVYGSTSSITKNTVDNRKFIKDLITKIRKGKRIN